MVPNYESIVQGVRDSKAWDFTTQAGLCAYHNACVYALYQADSNFGHLVKNEGQNHCTDPAGKFCATDVALYKATGQIVDFISSAGYGVPPPANAVTWQVGPEGEYPSSSWFAPVPNTDSGGGTPPPSGGGSSDAEMKAQLDRMEATINQMNLFLSNMNDQMALGFGTVNQVVARQDRPMAGTMVRHGDQLNLTPQG